MCLVGIVTWGDTVVVTWRGPGLFLYLFGQSFCPSLVNMFHIKGNSLSS